MRFIKVIKFKLLGAFKPGAFIYLVTNDKIFANKISLEIATNTSHDIVTKSSGEELLQELTYNPPPKRTLPLVFIDYKLSSRVQQDIKNGLEVLDDMKRLYPHYTVALLYDKKKKSIKNKALKAGADISFMKNDNVGIRILYFILTNVNFFQVNVERRLTKNAFIAFAVLFAIFSSIFLINAALY